MTQLIREIVLGDDTSLAFPDSNSGENAGTFFPQRIAKWDGSLTAWKALSVNNSTEPEDFDIT